ncbi:MAG: hypothetical protein ABI557_04160, partial [Aureliella sp.]
MNEPIESRLTNMDVLQSYRSRLDLFKRLGCSPHNFLRAGLLCAAAFVFALSGFQHALHAQASETAKPTIDL